MAKTKPAAVNNQVVVIVFLGALLLGYLVGLGKNTRFQQYAKISGQMMQREGRNMMEAGSMMAQAGQMMQRKGKLAGDQEMMTLGQTLEQRGSLMGTGGQGMMNQGTGMMGVQYDGYEGWMKLP